MNESEGKTKITGRRKETRETLKIGRESSARKSCHEMLVLWFPFQKLKTLNRSRITGHQPEISNNGSADGMHDCFRNSIAEILEKQVKAERDADRRTIPPIAVKRSLQTHIGYDIECSCLDNHPGGPIRNLWLQV